MFMYLIIQCKSVSPIRQPDPWRQWLGLFGSAQRVAFGECSVNLCWQKNSLWPSASACSLGTNGRARPGMPALLSCSKEKRPHLSLPRTQWVSGACLRDTWETVRKGRRLGGGKMTVSLGRGWSRAMKFWDAAHLPSQDEISGGNCECIAVRVAREGRKHPWEVLAVCA